MAISIFDIILFSLSLLSQFGKDDSDLDDKASSRPTTEA
jgi:hypothetical protein